MSDDRVEVEEFLHVHGTHRLSDKVRYSVITALLFVTFVIEVVGSRISGSVSLFGDAGHVLSDAVSWLVALRALWIVENAGDLVSSAQVRMMKARGTLINGVLLTIVLAVAILSVIGRFRNPHHVHGAYALVFIAVGLFLNYACLLLFVHSARKGALERSVWLHIVFDTLSSACALFSAFLVWWTGKVYWDPILGSVIVLILTPAAFRLVYDAYREMRLVRRLRRMMASEPREGA